MAGLDKSHDNAFYEIWIDPETQRPVRIRYLVLVAPIGGRTKAAAKIKKGKILDGKHYVFHFDFTISDFGEIKPFSVPKEARAVLAKIKDLDRSAF